MKRPTIKGTNRAYVRLYDCVIKHQRWEDFISKYQVQIKSHGQERHGDCAIQVIGSDGLPARLGPNIPNQISYSNFIHPARETWIEYFSDEHTNWKVVTPI